MIIAVWLFLVALLAAAGLLAGLVVLLTKWPKPTLAVLGVLVAVVLLGGMFVSIAAPVAVPIGVDLPDVRPQGPQSMTYARIGLAVPVLGLLLTMLVGLIVLIVKWPKPTLAVMGVMAVVVVLLGGLLVGVRTTQQRPVSIIERMPQVSAPLPADWDPDVHPSVREAVLSRVPLMAQLVRNLTGGAYQPEHVHVRGDVDIDMLREFAERLGEQDAFANARITWRSGEALMYEETLIINVNMHIERQRQQHWSHNGVRHDFNLWREGRVMVTAARGGRTASPPNARFIEKPWVEDWSGFIANSQPGQNWLRAESRSPATSPQEAQQQAINEAVEMLLPLAQTSLYGPTPLRQDLVGQLRGQLSQGQLIVDRFVQRVDRPYGQLYTATLLIDGSPAAVEGLTANLTQVRTKQRKAVLSTAGSLAALMGVIALLYLFLTAVTKGYYRPQLVAFVVAAAAAVVMLVVLA
jgi:hypothetical protein